MSQDPYKPPKHVDTGVPADYPYPQQQQQQQYGHPQQQQQMYPPPPYAAAPAPQYVQVDQFGRPIVNAVPAPAAVTTHVVPNNANIRRDAQGNALCNKCAAPYPLPAGCTSWRCVRAYTSCSMMKEWECNADVVALCVWWSRCRNCGELNNASVYGDECCTIL